MKHMDKTLITAAAVLAAAISLPGTASADDAAAASDDARIVTEFRGSPPFKRRVVKDEAAAERTVSDAERRENDTDDDADSSERVLVVDRRGAPPYKRRFVAQDDLEVAEFARFEEAADERRMRRGPPGKLTSRR